MVDGLGFVHGQDRFFQLDLTRRFARRDERLLTALARCRPAPEGWGDWARGLRGSLLTDRCGWARRSRLARKPGFKT